MNPFRLLARMIVNPSGDLLVIPTSDESYIFIVPFTLIFIGFLVLVYSVGAGLCLFAVSNRFVEPTLSEMIHPRKAFSMRGAGVSTAVD
jgi:hypothetical protein